jgi:hypothetical protein
MIIPSRRSCAPRSSLSTLLSTTAVSAINS